MKFSVYLLRCDNVEEEALDWYDRTNANKKGLKKALKENRVLNGQEVSCRVQVNYLRHQKTNYDRLISDALQYCTIPPKKWMKNGLEVKQGKYNQLVREIKKECLRQIAEKYPHLQEECRKQSRRA